MTDASAIIESLSRHAAAVFGDQLMADDGLLRSVTLTVISRWTDSGRRWRR